MTLGARAAMLAAAVAALVAVPVAMRTGPAAPPAGAAEVIVWTPNNEQIRAEFGEAFARWHERRFGTPATVTWNTPGGIGDIRRILEAGAVAALRAGTPVGGGGDVLFGGGLYDFEQLTRPVEVTAGGERRSATLLEPIAFDPAFLQDAFGDGTVGGRPLLDPQGHWFASALAAFGLAWNNDALARLGVPAPTGWEALADPRLAGEVALVNPAQSGSVATAMETVLRQEGWERGWAILRRAAANARTVAASGTRAPVDVASGEAAIAPCIDFYGRSEQQSVADGGSPGRMGYMEPAGRTAVEPDPIGLLRGAPHPETARRFIEFVLSADGQRLWQLPPGSEGGPRRFALRRLPARRSLYAAEGARFMDRVDPWAIAGAPRDRDPDLRAFVAPIFVALAVDNRDALRDAWARIRAHPAYPRDGRVLLARDASDPGLRAMLEAFDAMPTVPGPDGARFDLSVRESLAPVRAGWLRGGWEGTGLWRTGEAPAEAFRRVLAAETARQLAAVGAGRLEARR